MSDRASDCVRMQAKGGGQGMQGMSKNGASFLYTYLWYLILPLGFISRPF